MRPVREVVRQLEAKARKKNLDGMARFGLTTKNRLGVSMPDIRRIARSLGRDHRLAMALWRTGIPDCRITASIIADPVLLTSREMDRWVKDFDSWDVCDQVCMNLFEQSPLARRKIVAWAARKEEFVRRAAFALLACLAWHEKEAADTGFLPFLRLIKRHATDDRNFVMKAVNWALRNIGKRNAALRKAAIRTAKEIRRLDSPAARWIASDALRELSSR